MKSWLIKVSAPICGTDTYYCAFSENDPLGCDDFPFQELADNLWDNYSYLLHLDDEEYEDEEEERSAIDEAYENWCMDCNYSSEEMSLEKLRDYIPGGPTPDNDLPEIIYDERDGK